MVKILKHFHIHWNQLRLTNQIDRVKVETKNMMQRILQQYHIKEHVLFDVAKNVVDKIKLAYGNFVRAHLNHQMLVSKGPQIIGKAILGRYQQSINEL